MSNKTDDPTNSVVCRSVRVCPCQVRPGYKPNQMTCWVIASDVWVTARNCQWRKLSVFWRDCRIRGRQCLLVTFAWSRARDSVAFCRHALPYRLPFAFVVSFSLAAASFSVYNTRLSLSVCVCLSVAQERETHWPLSQREREIENSHREREGARKLYFTRIVV